MTEAELIKSIKGLNQIKPNQEWVFSVRNRIIGESPYMASVKVNMGYRLLDYVRFLTYKPALATIACLGILITTVAFAKDSVPGDLLFPVKKIVERSQSIFISKDKLAQYQLQETEKRLDDLAKIAEQNQTKKIASGMNEFKSSLVQAAKNIKSGTISKEIIDQAKQIAEKKAEVEKTLGVIVGDSDDLDNAIRDLVNREITDLEKRTMTEIQTAFLNSAKEAIESGDYNQALEDVWLISNQTEEEQPLEDK